MPHTLYGREVRDGAAWSFETDRFFVGFFAEPEDMDPDTLEDAEAIYNGDLEWFCARVSVYLKGDSDWGDGWIKLGSDYLGGCAYKTISGFYKPRDGYFPGMVREAIREARYTLRTMSDVAATMRQDA